MLYMQWPKLTRLFTDMLICEAEVRLSCIKQLLDWLYLTIYGSYIGLPHTSKNRLIFGHIY